jgi:HAD superfamily hydrolase (TIGR01458 family)
VRGLLIDLDGVVYDAESPIPGAAEALGELRREGLPFLFVTNTTSRPRAALVEKLRGFGVTAEADDIWTPAAAARQWLSERVEGPLALFAPAALREDLQGVDLIEEDAASGAAAVLIGDLGEGWSFPVLNRAFRLLHSDPACLLVALGMTRYWRAPEGVSLDAAPFVKALEHASGREAVVLGKPSKEFFLAAATRLGLPEENLLMIGDDLRTDVAGAKAAGMMGALVRTGKFREADLEREIHPDAVFASLAAAPAALSHTKR